MLPRRRGSILVTGASASVKGYANSSSFAMGKFGLRGLCQSLARELQPRGIHVAPLVIDGGIGRPRPDGATPGGAQPDHPLPAHAHLAPAPLPHPHLPPQPPTPTP